MKNNNTNSYKYKMLDKLNEDIYYLIYHFLTKDDKHNFNLISKKILNEMTLVNKIIKFNKEQSLEYCYNFDFRKLINWISNNKKIYLNYSYNEKLYEKFYISNIYNINLSSTNISLVNNLHNIHTLDLSCCHNIKSINGIYNIKKLILFWCENIECISNLHDIDELNCQGCINLKIFLNVQNINTLNLLENENFVKFQNCENIKNIINDEKYIIENERIKLVIYDSKIKDNLPFDIPLDLSDEDY